MRYRSHGIFHCEIRSFSLGLFSQNCIILLFDIISPICNETLILFSMLHLVFASQSVQWPTTRSWIFTIFWVICSSLPNVTSHQQTDVPNIVQAKNYPEVRTFWRLFYWPKMAESSYLLSHFNAMSNNTCLKPDEGYILLGAFESALCGSNHFVFSKWLFLKGIWP